MESEFTEVPNLPPLKFSFVLPDGYPTVSSTVYHEYSGTNIQYEFPIFTLSSYWLSLNQLEQLALELIEYEDTNLLNSWIYSLSQGLDTLIRNMGNEIYTDLIRNGEDLVYENHRGTKDIVGTVFKIGDVFIDHFTAGVSRVQERPSAE